MFGGDYKKYKNQIIQTTNEFYTSVVDRLQSQYLFYMTAAWTMIIIINISLILLIVHIKHKENMGVVTRPKRIVKKRIVKKVIEE
jgi:hypothetical protein